MTSERRSDPQEGWREILERQEATSNNEGRDRHRMPSRLP